MFDLDGTLTDHDSAATAALTRTLQATSDLPEAEYGHVCRRWVELERNAMARYLVGELTFTAQRRFPVVSLAAELGLGAWDEVQADTWFTEYTRHYESAWRAYGDVWPSLDMLSQQHPHLRLGVLTNGDADQERRKLENVGLAVLLPQVIISGEVGTAKPDEAIFRLACDLLQLAPEQVAHVGDRLSTDVFPARRARMYGIWLNRNGEPAPRGLPTVQTLRDIPALLSNLGPDTSHR